MYEIFQREISKVEYSIDRHFNANLIVSAANACIEINKENPQTVAEAIEDMYKALKDMPIPEPITVNGKDYMAVPYKLMAAWWINKRNPILAKAEGK